MTEEEFIERLRESIAELDAEVRQLRDTLEEHGLLLPDTEDNTEAAR